MSLIDIINEKVNNNELTIEEVLIKEKIEELPFSLDFWIGKDVPIDSINIDYYTNLEVYNIEIWLEDRIEWISKTKKIITNKNWKIIDNVTY